MNKKYLLPVLLLALVLSSCNEDSSSAAVPVTKDDVLKVEEGVPSSLSGSVLAQETKVKANGKVTKDYGNTYKERWAPISYTGEDPYEGVEFAHRTYANDTAGSYEDAVTDYTYHTRTGKYYKVTSRLISGYSDGKDPVSADSNREEYEKAKSSSLSFYREAYTYYSEAYALLDYLKGSAVSYEEKDRTIRLSRRLVSDLVYYMVTDSYSTNPALTYTYTLSFYEADGRNALLYASKTKEFFFASEGRIETSLRSYSFTY